MRSLIVDWPNERSLTLGRVGVLCCFTAILAVAGCDKQGGTGTNGSGQGSDSRSRPAESFQRVVDDFRRAVETAESVGPAFSVATGEGAHSRLEFERSVKDELLAPEEENGNYRGIITVITNYSYTFRPAIGEQPSKDDEKPAPGDGDGLLALEGSAAIVEVDPLLGDAGAGQSAKKLPKSLLTTREDKDERSYELAYEDGRWVLKTELDKETELSIEHGFDFALKRQ